MSGHFDIALFDVDRGLQERLGYDKVYSAGRDLLVSSHPAPGIPAIATGGDSGALITELRKPDVIGIAFDGAYIDKKAIEKAAEYGKPVFIFAARFTGLCGREKGAALHGLRKLFMAAHSLKARVVLVSMADSRAQLLSSAQLREIAHLISGGQDGGMMSWGGIT